MRVFFASVSLTVIKASFNIESNVKLVLFTWGKFNGYGGF